MLQTAPRAFLALFFVASVLEVIVVVVVEDLDLEDVEVSPHGTQ